MKYRLETAKSNLNASEILLNAKEYKSANNPTSRSAGSENVPAFIKAYRNARSTRDAEQLRILLLKSRYL